MGSTLLLDESIDEQNGLLAVAGLIVSNHRLQALSEGWRALKRDTFGIDPDLELKYNIPDDHPCRKPLDDAGWIQSRRVPEMLDHIARTPVKILADVLLDLRDGEHPADFYISALNWCIRRFANDASAAGPHTVIVDMPPRPGDVRDRRLDARWQEMYEKASGTAPFAMYARMYREEEQFPGGAVAPSLQDSGFLPMLVASHAKHSELLQMADVAAGCVRDFCAYNLTASSTGTELPYPDYQDENMARIAGRLRKQNNQVAGRGFDLFPKDHARRPKLLERVEELAADSG